MEPDGDHGPRPVVGDPPLGGIGNVAVPQLFVLPSLARQIDALPALRSALWDLEASLLKRLWLAAAGRDPDAASELGARLGQLLGPRSHKHKHVVGNLGTAFPHWLPHRVEAMARRVWGSIGRTLIEYPLLERIADPVSERVRVVDLGGLAEVRRLGRPAIFVGAHLANWNLIPAVASRSGIPLTAVYRRMRNPVVERLVKGWLSAPGFRLLEVQEASRPLLRELQAGRSVGLLMDQRYDRGEKIPFFGVPATTTLGPARLALRLDLPLIPVRVQRLEGARFVVTVCRPVRPDPGLDEEAAARAMTAAVNDRFARWIAAAPEQWFCAKRRWPRQRPRIPKRGKVSLT